MRKMLISSLALGLMTACNLGPSTTDDDTTDDTASPTDSGVSVVAIQDGTIGEGETVTLTGVIVTSTWDERGDGFFIQDAGGGEYSGVYVYAPGLSDTYLEVGYELTVTGATVEYYDWTEFTVADASALEITGSGPVTSDSVDPSTVTDWEVWESCLISVGAATATSGVNSYGEITLDNGLKLDNWFFDYAGEQGASWTNISGTLLYNFEEFKLAPRSADDLEGYVEGEGPPEATVAQTQDGTIAEDESVTIVGAVVTSPIKEGKNSDGDWINEGFFVQDEGGGSGLYVYDPGVEGLAPGDVVNLVGTVIEYYDLTELSDAEIEKTGATATVVPTVVNSAPSDWEPLEGQLVQFDNLEVTAEGEYGEVETSYGVNIDDLFTDSPAVGTYTRVTGIVNYSYGEFKICPRTTDDVVQ